jgi:membrane-associated PAP2 superfamily phosphatase
MIPNETKAPAKSVAEQVVKICLIIAIAMGTLSLVLRLIRGENFFHAILAIAPAISILVVFYWMILWQRRSQNTESSVSQHAEISGTE